MIECLHSLNVALEGVDYFGRLDVGGALHWEEVYPESIRLTGSDLQGECLPLKWLFQILFAVPLSLYA
jgi:hypothetical protein